MSENISGIISLRFFLRKEDSIMGYVVGDDLDEVAEWKLKKNRKYEIPGYQREIKWEINNVKTFIEDIKQSDKFLGNVLISTTNRSLYQIIDGQQRITVTLMLLECVKQKHSSKESTITVCDFENKTFDKFFELIQHNFLNIEKPDVIESDKLLQRNRLKTLWECMNKCCEEWDDRELREFEEHLLDSEINLMIVPSSTSTRSRRLCVDYFIDMNNKGRHLDSVDILKAYAFRGNFDEASNDWIKVQQNTRELYKIVYPKETMFLHYILCTVNSELEEEYESFKRLKSLSDDLQLLNDDVIGGKNFPKGTDIEEIIKDNGYYSKLLKSVLYFQELERATMACKGGAPDEKFISFFKPSDHNLSIETIKNIFKIIIGILCHSDVVPKLLLMKYFTDIMQNSDAKADDFKTIYDIDVVSVCFSAGKGNMKTRNSFYSLVMSKNWRKNLSKRAQNNLKSYPGNILFGKEIRYDGKPTKTSGQFLAERVCALSAGYEFIDGKYVINEQKYFEFYYNGTINVEHFLITQSLKISYLYKGEKVIERKKGEKFISIPQGMESHMTYLGNYLVIKRSINENLENYSLREKMHLIEKYLSDGKGEVFEDKISIILFDLAKRFIESDECTCPTQEELDKEEDGLKAGEKLQQYYTNRFQSEIEKYFKSIKVKDYFSW